MTDHERQSDRFIDSNLRRMAARWPLPAQADLRRRASWKQAPRPDDSPSFTQTRNLTRKGDSFMRRHRKFVFGSAAAAVVTLAVVLMTPSQRNVVQASTIFREFSRSLTHGISLTFENVGDEGAMVTGRLIATLDDSNQAGGDDAGSYFYIEAHVVGREDAEPDMRGLDVHATLAFAPEKRWAHVRVLGLPEEIVQQAPIVLMFMNTLRGGLLLDLNELGHVFADGKVNVGIDAEDMSELRDLPAEIAKELRLELGNTRRDLREHADGGQANEVERALNDLLDGKATAEQIRLLVERLEQSAGQVSVKEVEPGLHVLTASAFRPEDGSEHGAIDWAKDMKLTIRYREGTGIERALIEDLGPYHGRIELETTSGVPEADLLDDGRFRNDGATTVLDFTAISKMMNLMQSGGSH